MIVDPDFVDHWKTRMLVDLLGGDELAPVYLIRLWAHCQHRRAWVFDGVPPAALKAICRFGGSADQLDSAMRECRFIVRDDGGVLEVRSWDEYNAQLIANWKNGKKGGRPKKSTEPHPKAEGQPAANHQVTHGLPTGIPSESHGVSDRMGCDVIGGTNSRRRYTAGSEAVDNSPAGQQQQKTETTTEGNRTDSQPQNPGAQEIAAGGAVVVADEQRLGHGAASGMAPVFRAPDDGLPVLSVSIEWLQERGVQIDASNDLLIGWRRAGVTEGQFIIAIGKAKTYKLKHIPANYLATIIDEMINPPERASKRIALGDDEKSLKAAARELGMDEGRQGESLKQYKARILERMNDGRRAA
ncbi:hypothetical protein K7N18_10385 [Burkholderia arboris]|uniref:hypothetical protein n=1 Tax=Burkholderia arboris TaxID=488730 RepID=UPI001CA4573E|nr:hypothetical protein [Burkholderia arboris]MBY8605245.1 hypothetical protein [Burkholderia arboris]